MSYPTLPPDFVYLGLGGTFKTGGFGFNCMVSYDSSEWNRNTMAGGTNTRLHYCAHKDSEIVKLNTSAPAPIAAAQPTQFIVWSDGRGEPTKIHASRDTADAEAQRLAAKHPTMMFSVCEIVARYKATVTVNKI
jgi:hypothetical protein